MTSVPAASRTTSSGRRAPGPSRVGAALLYVRARDPFVFLERCVDRYGDVYSLPLGPGGTTVVNHADLVGSWLSDYSRYHKGVMSQALRPALGDGIPVSDGDKWRRNRKALNPMFGRKSLDGLARIIAGSLADSMDRWDSIAASGEEVDIYRELSIMTMQALQRSMFSSSVDDRDVPELVDLFRIQTRYMGGLMAVFWAPSWVPVPGARRGAPAVAAIRCRIDAAVAHRRVHPTDASDLLNLLLDTVYEDTSEPLSNEELRDELMGLWFGGYDTTGSALAWAIALLSRYPEAAARLSAEAAAYAGDFSSLADTNDMPYAKAAFDEAQRFQGALLLTRQALEDDQIGGYYVPAGSQVGVSAYTLNRHPDLWPNPDCFDPERFLGDKRQEQHRYQWVQFGAGPRHCIGMSMAYLEAQFALTMIFQRFSVELRPGFEPRHQFHLSVGIKGGLPGRIHRRQGVNLRPHWPG